METGNKQCTICGIVKPRTDFEKNRRACKSCKRAQVRVFHNSSYQNFLKKKLNDAKTRCKKYKFDIDINIEHLVDLHDRQKGKCALTGFPMHHTDEFPDFAISIDRIDTSLGYQKGNCRLVCVRANMIRNELTDEILVWWARAIVNNSES